MLARFRQKNKLRDNAIPNPMGAHIPDIYATGVLDFKHQQAFARSRLGVRRHCCSCRFKIRAMFAKIHQPFSDTF